MEESHGVRLEVRVQHRRIEVEEIGKGAADGILYLADWQDGNGTWHAAGSLPNSSPGFSALKTVNGNHGNLNLIGLGSNDGELYIADWQDSSGGWHGAGLRFLAW